MSNVQYVVSAAKITIRVSKVGGHVFISGPDIPKSILVEEGYPMRIEVEADDPLKSENPIRPLVTATFMRERA